MVPSKRMAEIIWQCRLLLVFRGTKYRFQNNEATYAYSSEIQKEIRWLKM
jgi:hypothetical protein